MGRTAWRAYLAAGVLLSDGYYLLPSGPQAVLYVAEGVSCVAAVWFGASRNRPDRPAAWWLLGGGQLAFAAGDALFYVNDLILHIEPFPSLADGFYLAGYPLVAAGLAVLLRGRVPRRDWRAVADATIIAVGFGLLPWVLVMVPYVRDPELTLLERVFSLAYPVGDVLLLALAARLAVAPGRRSVAYPLLVASLVCTMAGDLLFSVLALTQQYTGVSAADAAYLLGYLLLGAAALHPSMARLSQPAPERRARLPRGRLLAMGAAALVAPRHAHAGRIRLELEGVEDRVELQISDDGVGFEPVPSSALVRDGHFGLVGMRERVELAGGSWQVEARPGSGVTIRASFHGASTAA